MLEAIKRNIGYLKTTHFAIASLIAFGVSYASYVSDIAELLQISKLTLITIIFDVLLILYLWFFYDNTNIRIVYINKKLKENTLNAAQEYKALRKDILKMSVLMAYERYKDKTHLTVLQKKEIHDLEKTRIILSVNSFSEALLDELVNKATGSHDGY